MADLVLVGGIGLIWESNESNDNTNRYGIILIQGLNKKNPTSSNVELEEQDEKHNNFIEWLKVGHIDILNLLMCL